MYLLLKLTFTTVKDELNSIQTVSPHLSISGVENWPASIRFASTMNDIVGDYFDNEVEAVDLYEAAKGAYGYAEYFHKTERDSHTQSAIIYGAGCGWWSSICAAIAAYNVAQAVIHNNGYQKWQNGRIALQDIDNRWANLHNGDILTVNGTRQQRYWADCGTGSPPGGWDINSSVED